MQILHRFAGSIQRYSEELSDPDRYRPDHCPQCEAHRPLSTHGFYTRTLVDIAFDGANWLRWGPYADANGNTNGRVTGLAVANASGQAANLAVSVRDDLGTVLQTGSISLAAHGHFSTELTTAYSMSAGKRGTVQFDGPAAFSALGLFFTPAGNVTTLPVFTPTPATSVSLSLGSPFRLYTRA